MAVGQSPIFNANWAGQLSQVPLAMISSKNARSVAGLMPYGSKLADREYFRWMARLASSADSEPIDHWVNLRAAISEKSRMAGSRWRGSS